MERTELRRSGLAAVVTLSVAILALILVARPIRFDSPASAGARALRAVDASIGATLEPIEREPAARRGMIVTSLASGGPAERAGLRVGDVIEKIGPSPAADVKASAAAVAQLPTAVIVRRDGKHAIVEIAANTER